LLVSSSKIDLFMRWRWKGNPFKVVFFLGLVNQLRRERFDQDSPV